MHKYTTSVSALHKLTIEKNKEKFIHCSHEKKKTHLLETLRVNCTTSIDTEYIILYGCGVNVCSEIKITASFDRHLFMIAIVLIIVVWP